MASLRYQVEPRDIAPDKAARRLGLDLERFEAVLPQLLSRGFPPPDIDTGNFDLDAIDAWRAARHRPLPSAPELTQAGGRVRARLAVGQHGAG